MRLTFRLRLLVKLDKILAPTVDCQETTDWFCHGDLSHGEMVLADAFFCFFLHRRLAAIRLVLHGLAVRENGNDN